MNKYRNIKTEIDGILFDSKREAQRYIVLRGKQKEGLISGLILQPKFVLQEGFKYRGERFLPITYRADFQYKEGENIIIEDVKGGPVTQAYAIKKKMLIEKFSKGHKNFLFREIR